MTPPFDPQEALVDMAQLMHCADAARIGSPDLAVALRACGFSCEDDKGRRDYDRGDVRNRGMGEQHVALTEKHIFQVARAYDRHRACVFDSQSGSNFVVVVMEASTRRCEPWRHNCKTIEELKVGQWGEEDARRTFDTEPIAPN